MIRTVLAPFQTEQRSLRNVLVFAWVCCTLVVAFVRALLAHTGPHALQHAPATLSALGMQAGMFLLSSAAIAAAAIVAVAALTGIGLLGWLVATGQLMGRPAAPSSVPEKIDR